MLTEIGSIENVPAFIDAVKAGHGAQRLQGFGHRGQELLPDPRATIIKRVAGRGLHLTGKNPLLDIAPQARRTH